MCTRKRDSCACVRVFRVVRHRKTFRSRNFEKKADYVFIFYVTDKIFTQPSVTSSTPDKRFGLLRNYGKLFPIHWILVSWCLDCVVYSLCSLNGSTLRILIFFKSSYTLADERIFEDPIRYESMRNTKIIILYFILNFLWMTKK